jgi:hypothetical protein
MGLNKQEIYIMKVVVCGGRDYHNAALIWRTLDRLHKETPFTDLMQGGARGADKHAKEWAATNPEIKRWVCRAQWDRDGKAAGPIRNSKMVGWKPDLVIAFPGGKGTDDMVKKALLAGIRVERVD